MWNTAGIVMKFLSARLLLFDEHLLTCHGVWERAARVWNTAALVRHFNSSVAL